MSSLHNACLCVTQLNYWALICSHFWEPLVGRWQPIHDQSVLDVKFESTVYVTPNRKKRSKHTQGTLRRIILLVMHASFVILRICKVIQSCSHCVVLIFDDHTRSRWKVGDNQISVTQSEYCCNIRQLSFNVATSSRIYQCILQVCVCVYICCDVIIQLMNIISTTILVWNPTPLC